MTNLLTEKEYQEADIWLAEQMGEHVHKWFYNQEEQEWKCYRCGGWEVENSPDMGPPGPPPTVHTPRSKDLGAMVNIAERVVVRNSPHEKFIIRFFDAYDLVFGRGSTYLHRRANLDSKYYKTLAKEYYKDHESPQHAAAWAIYLALREVKEQK